MPYRRINKADKQRMRSVRTALKFRVELNAYIERSVCKLYRFDEISVRRSSAYRKSGVGKSCFIFVVKFISVTVTLVYLGLAVTPFKSCTFKILQG